MKLVFIHFVNGIEVWMLLYGFLAAAWLSFFMKNILMRDLFCKFYCPSFVCFCKSPVPVFSPCSLKLEDGQHDPLSLPSLAGALEQPSGDKIEVEKDRGIRQIEIVPKSSLKKPDGTSSREDIVKRRIQWMDFIGKELAEVKEYEPSESGESADDGSENRGCVCVIQ